MATVTFYQKPGCGTNARQVRALEAAGHTVIARSLLTEHWRADDLRAFFADTPVDAWFNPAAPGIKSGAVKPAEIDADSAISLMLANPLLVRRPLIEVDGRKCAGFDTALVVGLLGGARDDLEGCSRPVAAPRCAAP